jgi:hypothetical protein
MMENPVRFNPVLIETIRGMLDDQRAEVSASR